MKKINWLLVIAVFLAFILRVVWLDRYPTGFTPDEANFGYNAYSILKTGRDEWGEPWWKLFFTNMRSFGDYKLPLYSFVAIPAVGILGLNEFSTRLPNVIFGALAVVGIYFLAQKLFPERKLVSLISAFALAVSPWHIQLSRGAFEANLIVFFLPWIIYFFWEGKYLWSAVFAAVSMYSYHTARYFMPFLGVLLLLFKSVKFDKKLLIAGVVFLVLSIPALVSVFGVGKTRISDLSIFSPTDNWAGVSNRRFEARLLELPDPIARIFSNKVTQTFANITRGYLSYLSFDYLFINGAGEATYGMMPGRGVMYMFELVFVVGYIIVLIQSKSKSMIFVGLLLLIAPIPAILAKSMGSAANRVAPMLPALVLMVAVGIDQLWRYKNIICVVYLVGLAFLAEDYFYHAPKLNAPAMSFGWRELMPRLSGLASDYDEVYISRSLSEPQVFLAFYSQMDPVYYQNQAKAWKDFDKKGFRFLDQYDGYRLGKYRIGNLDFNLARGQKTLLVGRPSDIPESMKYHFQIFYPDDKVAIQVSEFKK
jgi:4-amino-4-deoxy-L-arabinose transferase-like glycosyltransferase